jgi:hypothetical protein
MSTRAYRRWFIPPLAGALLFGVQACSMAHLPPPPPGATAQGCWIYVQRAGGGKSPVQQPAAVRQWTDDPKPCARTGSQG